MTTFSATVTPAPRTAAGNTPEPALTRAELESVARGCTRAGIGRRDSRRRSKSSARRWSAEFPTPITPASIGAERASAGRSSSPPSTRGSAPGRSVKPATVQSHAAARSATARPWPPAPRIRRRRGIRTLSALGRDGCPPLAEQKLREQEVPLRVDIDRGFEIPDDRAVVLTEHAPLVHQHLVARHVDGARRLVHRRRVLPPHVLVTLVKERDRAVTVERLHEKWMVGGLRHRLCGVRPGRDDLRDGLIDVGPDAERRGRLDRDDEVRANAGRPLA